MRKAKRIFNALIIIIFLFSMIGCSESSDSTSTEKNKDNLPNISGYPIVGTNQTIFFNTLTVTSEQSVGDPFYGQNANYPGNVPKYVDNGDGTVTDMVTGLMWQSSFDHNRDGEINYDDKVTYSELLELVDTVSTGGYTDWRLPTIKELYSLIMFSGRDVSGYQAESTETLKPFINTDYFDFAYGDIEAGERIIDMQCATITTFQDGNLFLIYGVNFADGRIKGYGTQMPRPWGMEDKKFNYLLVRGNKDYGKNNFIDNGDGTISDLATGLMWSKEDSKEGMTWQQALAWVQQKNKEKYLGYSDWRLPDAKELQSIVDYSRSPETTNSPAIDPLFECTQITNENGEKDYPYYWTSTTHINMMEGHEGAWAVYIAFGRGLGYMEGKWSDVHGPGCQRSDPKEGDPSEFANGHGPQGDAVRIYNYIRLVRYIK